VSSSTFPPARAQGCAVIQASSDKSSFNIYYYGGYPAVDPISDFFDDVWVLSLPSFRWIKAKDGNVDHARAGHRCVTPYPNQMMVLGGWTPLAGNSIACLARPIEILNLTSLQWLEEYDPVKYYEYGVPDVVFKEIGGNSDGGATQKQPAVSGGWQDASLSKVFDTPYPTKIDTYYPYDPNAPEPTRIDVVPSPNGKGSDSLPKWVPPVLGTVLGLVFVTAVVVAFLLFRRRKYLRRSPSSVGERSRVREWLGRQDTKAVTETTVEDLPPGSPPLSPLEGFDNVSSPVAASSPVDGRVEGPDNQIHELPGEQKKKLVPVDM
jgi:hypothetical protein